MIHHHGSITRFVLANPDLLIHPGFHFIVLKQWRVQRATIVPNLILFDDNIDSILV